MKNRFLFTALLYASLVQCDKGLEPPPPPPPTGTIYGIVNYQGTWPSADSLLDMRFVAFRVIPRSPSDFTNIFNFEFTRYSLKENVVADTFLISDVPNGNYPYSGIAQRYGPSSFADWRPVGLFTGNFGRGIDVEGDTVRISVVVNWANIPPFPPAKGILP